MSARPAVLESALAPFVNAGHRVSVVGTHLLLHDVPVVNEQRRLELGTLVCTFLYTDAAVTPPATHQAWFDGPYPCFASGQRINELFHSDVAGGEIAPGVRAKHFFSNKATNWNGYATHHELLMHYWRIITDQARVLDPNCTRPVGAGSAHVVPTQSPFNYPDACAARANLELLSAKLALSKVAIVGLGGTGSYVLDLLAKTEVREIHLFDLDAFEPHNAFRAPGAAALGDFGGKKVDYYAKKYAPMRRGVIAHPQHITDENRALLAQFDFVFVCVDKGPARALICNTLLDAGVPFIDCGLDLSLKEGLGIYGTCRVTMCGPGQREHFQRHAPTMEDAGDDLYAQNIQTSEANAMCAIFAVMRWKQYLGYYVPATDSDHFEFMLGPMRLARAGAVRVEQDMPQESPHAN